MSEFAKLDGRERALLRKFKVFVSGLAFAFEDFNVSYKTIVSLIAIGISAYLYRWVDFLLIFVATGQVLVSELFNSAIEGICDFVQPEKDGQIKKVKDIAAAAASIGMFVWVVVILIQIANVLYYFLRGASTV